jgi:hypothetical protein
VRCGIKQRVEDIGVMALARREKVRSGHARLYFARGERRAAEQLPIFGLNARLTDWLDVVVSTFRSTWHLRK